MEKRTLTETEYEELIGNGAIVNKDGKPYLTGADQMTIVKATGRLAEKLLQAGPLPEA